MNYQYIVITRPVSENKSFKKNLEKLGYKVFSYPCIATKSTRIGEEEKTALLNINTYDWILFTSKSGVYYFLQALRTLKMSTAVLREKKIAVIGSKTAEAVRKNKMHVSLIPAHYTTKSLGETMKNIKNKKVLLPRARIATPDLIVKLQSKGAMVTNIAIYKTIYTVKENKKIEELLKNDQILCITFTSPSTVIGCIKSLSENKLRKKLLALPVLSIGPVTTKAARREGFQTIHTARIHTTEGMLKKLQEGII